MTRPDVYEGFPEHCNKIHVKVERGDGSTAEAVGVTRPAWVEKD